MLYIIFLNCIIVCVGHVCSLWQHLGVVIIGVIIIVAITVIKIVMCLSLSLVKCSWGEVVAYWLRCWTRDSRVVGSIPALDMVHLGNIIYPNLLQMSSNIVGKVPAMD